MSFESMIRAGDVMSECWKAAAIATDEQLDDAIEQARKNLYGFKRRFWKFLWWEFETSASKLGWEHKFNVWFYLTDAKKLRVGAAKLDVSKRDEKLMTRDQWLQFLQAARSEGESA